MKTFLISEGHEQICVFLTSRALKNVETNNFLLCTYNTFSVPLHNIVS